MNEKFGKLDCWQYLHSSELCREHSLVCELVERETAGGRSGRVEWSGNAGMIGNN